MQTRETIDVDSHAASGAVQCLLGCLGVGLLAVGCAYYDAVRAHPLFALGLPRSN